MSKKLSLAFIIISLIGVIDTTYLTVGHFTGSGLNCYVFSGCDIVTTSKYAVIFGIPLALLGALYYCGMFLLNILYLDIKKKPILYLIVLGGIVGFLTSLLLVYLQLFVLHQICEYCMLSALTSTILFVLGMILLKQMRTAGPHNNN